MYRFTRTMTAALPLLFVIAGVSASAQEPNPTATMPRPAQQRENTLTEGPNGTYIYRVKVVERTLDAVNYLNHSGSTHVNFIGTDLMPAGRGEGKIDPQVGKMHASVKFDHMTPANGFGHEYLTYVLWAISADGRPQNLGELELAGDKASLDVTVPFQSFGMIVTAEPYWSVSAPSDVIVLKNIFSDRTQGVLQQVNIHYALLPRGTYAATAGAHTNEDPITDREHYPLALYEAHAAARVARQAGADQYAADIMQEVATDLKNADDLQASKHRDVKMIFTYARSAAQRSEDARLVTLRKQAAEREAKQIADRKAAQDAAAEAQQQAQASQLAAANARAEADRSAADRAKADADRARAEADAANARAQAAEANRNAQKSTEDAMAVREKLRAQLNSVLATSESARGLIVNMSDVLFDTAKFSLKPGTQVSLAKVATILELYPGLKVQVEGYTDSVGGDEYNQKLSENRANSVHDFLVSNGVPASNVTAAGYGKSNPVADNGTAAGRAQNRRVNLVVSGDAIGVQTSQPGAGPQ